MLVHTLLLVNNMRLNLKVPFAEKDEAKKLGARWDAGRKVWFVEDKEDLAPFSRWLPVSHDTSASETRTQRCVSAKNEVPIGKVHVGSNYVEYPRLCECLPWEVCDKCRATALTN